MLKEYKIGKNFDSVIYREVSLAYDIVKNTNIVVFDWTIDPDVSASFVSKNISQFGYTQDDFYTGRLKNYWEFIYPEDRKRVKETVYKIREKEVMEFKHSYRILTKNNKIRWIEERIIFDRDENNNILSERGILIDITEIKKLEYELANSKKRYESIFENSSAIIMTLDSEGKIEKVNKKFVECLGYSKKKVMGMYIFDIIVENNSETIDLDFIRKNQSKLLEIKMRSISGDIKFLNMSANILCEENSVLQIEIVANDITEKKKDRKKIEFLSRHDSLTKLYNRAFYEEKLKEISKIGDYPYSLIIGDVNGLKEVNDILGHKKGDYLLKMIASILNEACDKKAIISRIGGDEFAIICPHTLPEEAQKICNKIKKLCIKKSDNSIIKPSIALGVATKYNKKSKIDDIIKEADDKMYRNKLTFSKSIRSSFVSAQQAILEEKTLETLEHANRIEENVLKVGKYLKFTQDHLDLLSLTALMHDIGKVGVPSEILLKKSKLTDYEYEIIKQHSLMGYNILKTSLTTKEVGEYVLHHHEWWDGSGYPKGLAGREIPLISRIICIADAYDVMITDQPYKKRMTKKDAIIELRDCSGTQFDPELVEIFIKNIKKD